MNVTLQIKYYQLYVIVYIRIHQTRMHNFQIFPDKSYQKSKQNSFYIRIRIFRGKKLLDLPPSLDFHPSHDLFARGETRIRVVPSPLHRSQISVQPFEIQEKSGKSFDSSFRGSSACLPQPPSLICAVKSVFPDRHPHEIFTKRLAATLWEYRAEEGRGGVLQN